MKKSKCKSCGADIYWVRMIESGKMMPIDANSIEKRVVLNYSLKHYVNTGEKAMGVIKDTAIPHWNTCPNSKQHRSK